QVEPDPVTVADAVLVRLLPTLPCVFETDPPPETVSVAAPLLPSVKVDELTQVEPAPVTVTKPLPPALLPTVPVVFVTSAPAVISSAPGWVLPTVSVVTLVIVVPLPDRRTVGIAFGPLPLMTKGAAAEPWV